MNKQGYTYLIKQNKYLKIGFTSDIDVRKKQYNTHNANFELLYYIKSNNLLEKKLHEKWKNFKFKNEWFNYTDEIINYFKYYHLYSDELNYDKKTNDFSICNADLQILYNIKPDFCVKVYLFLMNNSKNKEIFISQSKREEIQNTLSLSKSSVILALKVLNDNCLIKRIERGIYLINN